MAGPSSVLVPRRVAESLRRLAHRQFALLAGRRRGGAGEWLVAAAYGYDTAGGGGDNAVSAEIVRCSLPAGVDLLGLAVPHGGDVSRAAASVAWAPAGGWLALLVAADGEIDDWQVTSLGCSSSPLCGAVSLYDGDPMGDTVTLHVRASELLTIEMRDANQDVATTLRDHFASAMAALRSRLIDANSAYFECAEAEALLRHDPSGPREKKGQRVTGTSLLSGILARRESGAKLKSPHFAKNRLSFVVYQRATGADKTAGLHDCTPVVLTALRKSSIVAMPLRLLGTSIVECGSDGRAMAAAMHESLARCLDRIALTVRLFCVEVLQNENASLTKAPSLDCATFLPEGLAHFVDFVNVAGVPDELARAVRLRWHCAFGLPTDRPHLRPTCGHVFADESPALLIDVHANCKLESATGGSVSLVRGRYAYHHYMQDNVDDTNWGCAYRSLQTIWSWYRLQGYTELLPPSHRDIQQALVDVGDQPASFVGSRRWIGSMELSYVLGHLLGVESRVLTAANGAEVAGQAAALAAHFDTVGAPVMIGGGVLAHTILGVDYNECTGDVRFLVLDPHYTGDEHVQTIVSKGWCGWKQSSFWQPDAFYNMLLPQRIPGVL